MKQFLKQFEGIAIAVSENGVFTADVNGSEYSNRSLEELQTRMHKIAKRVERRKKTKYTTPMIVQERLENTWSVTGVLLRRTNFRGLSKKPEGVQVWNAPKIKDVIQARNVFINDMPQDTMNRVNEIYVERLKLAEEQQELLKPYVMKHVPSASKYSSLEAVIKDEEKFHDLLTRKEES